ncbi:ArsR/SmtB family transcription factor [Pseudemcibacter aquimaris]|uniref:ArsR/SmtB family transcription factor n=1 Tax=Pseudemcibacter aquimaris TaxID=2857064 RepID=UPI0020138786|nr:metalloregulator ArsR/SmtB family transcription factor [Pseudemcibacter aquimaris]MCC3859681.1 metalloregulator ArsR/SmtB family transcription factor [Pseudemcibacter aquimaris]WDU60076.1 metalloregulator ArsR/SmtB family transcription factor [Pseudemcibacter aquimaris]
MNEELVFKALGDPNRMKILNTLCDRDCPCSVGEVACCCTVDMSVVSRHLSTLKNAGIITAEKRGKEVFYHVNRSDVAALLRDIADRLEKPCCSNNRRN